MTGWIVLALLFGTVIVWVLIASFLRLINFHALVRYAELDRFSGPDIKTLQDVQIVLALALREKADLLCHRGIALAQELHSLGAMSDEDLRTVTAEFERYRTNVRKNPYLQHTDLCRDGLPVGDIQRLTDEQLERWRTLLEEIETHRLYVDTYNKLFGIPRNVV